VIPRKLTEWESAVDRQIREAQERGDFDRLPGRGRPLPDERWDGEWGLAHHVLKQAGETLPWISLGKEIDALQAKLQQRLCEAAGLTGEQRVRARQQYLRDAATLDTLLEEYAFLVPTRRLERGRLPQRIAEQQFDAATRSG
jgi:hypothetical protein